MKIVDLVVAGGLLLGSERAAGLAADQQLAAASFSDRGSGAPTTVPVAQAVKGRTKGQLALTADPQAPPDSASIETLRAFFSAGGNLSLIIALDGEPFDRLYDGQSTRGFSFSRSTFEAVRFHSINIPGDVVAIIAEVPERVDSLDRELSLINHCAIGAKQTSARDNPFEAFASFGDLLMELGHRPSLLMKFDPDNQRNLIRLCLGFESSLRSAGISETAPVFSAIDQLRHRYTKLFDRLRISS